MSLFRLCLAPLVLAALIALPAAPVRACPFCTMQGQTMLGETGQATIVLYGKLGQAWEAKDETELLVESPIKVDGKVVARDAKKVILNRYFYPTEGPEKVRLLVFGEVFQGKADYYRGKAFRADSKVVEYIQGALKVKDKKVPDRLRYFFAYLDDADVEISNDAYTEFGNADYSDFKQMASELPADRVRKWLRDPDTPTFRLGLYASMLGHCGKEADAAVLKELLDDPDKRSGSGVDGALAAFVLLKKSAGWEYLKESLKNEKNDFLYRFAALRAVRFLYNERPDVVGKKALLDGVCVLLDQEDIADLGIEDLRKWQAWDRADKVLAVVNKEPYKHSIVKRAILRFCLQAKDNKAAQQYVAERRKADPEAVADAEELLQLEKATETKDKTNPGK